MDDESFWVIIHGVSDSVMSQPLFTVGIKTNLPVSIWRGYELWF